MRDKNASIFLPMACMIARLLHSVYEKISYFSRLAGVLTG